MNKFLTITIVIFLTSSSLFGMKRRASHDGEFSIKKICYEKPEIEIFPLSLEHTRSIAYNSLVVTLMKHNKQNLIEDFERIKNKFIYNKDLNFENSNAFKILEQYHQVLRNERRIPHITICEGMVIIE